MNPLFAERGDTFFTKSSSLLGRLIRWGEKDPDESTGAWTNHAGVVVESGWIGGDPGLPGYKEAVVIEALWKTRRGPLKVNGVDVRVFRPVPAYTEEEKALFVAEAESYVGDGYGWWKLGGFLLKRATRGVVDVTKVYFIKNRPICSYMAAWTNEKARKIGDRSKAWAGPWPGFGMPPQSADPDEMLDTCWALPEFWQEVGVYQPAEKLARAS